MKSVVSLTARSAQANASVCVSRKGSIFHRTTGKNRDFCLKPTSSSVKKTSVQLCPKYSMFAGYHLF